MDELVDIVDENGGILRQATKKEAHKLGLLHKTVIGYLRDHERAWQLVRQASFKQDAGQFVGPVAGHVRAGETDTEALIREAKEEIGVDTITHSHIGAARFHRQVTGQDENHLFVVFEISTDDAIILGDESDEIERFKEADLKSMLAKRPDYFGDGFYFVLERFYPSYLPRDYSFRWADRAGLRFT